MNRDKAKGIADDAMGRAKRQAGEWTGDLNKQMDGAAQQIKGKAEKAWGNAKDAVHEANQQKENRSGGATVRTTVVERPAPHSHAHRSR